ncbi:hypothetical protein SAMN04488023_112115, partial [Pedobacter rhizosphaerae]
PDMAKASAVASPTPLDAPVMTTVLPERLDVALCFCIVIIDQGILFCNTRFTEMFAGVGLRLGYAEVTEMIERSLYR